MKKPSFNPFDLLSEEILFTILDCLEENPLDKKSFSLVCKSFYLVESRHRKTLKPLRSELLTCTLNRYPCITHLDLSLCPRVNDNSLSVVSGLCKSPLRSIDLSRSKFFSHVGLTSLALNCSSLVEIDLSNGTELTDFAAKAIAKAKNLEKLSLARCKRISDLGIGCIAVGCRKLRVISLKWCLSVSDLGVGLLAVKCKEIRSLDLSYVPVLNISHCQNVGHVGLSSLINGAENLRQLVLAYGSPVTLSLAEAFQKFSKLHSIKLNGCMVTCDGLNAIGNCCIPLRELSLSKCSGVTDEGLSFLLSKHRELKKLDITCCRKITHVSIDSITTSCTSLVSLRMESCSLVPKEAFILIGQRCYLLEELDLTDNKIDNEGLKFISRCSELSSLKIGICLNITDEGLTNIGMFCPKLIELDLYRSTGITDIGIAAIARGCHQLKMINVAYCKDITDNSLRSLSKCSRLNTLEIRGCPCISSVGLSAIAVGCKQLTRLDIKKCHDIDDVGMLSLAHFSQNLTQINLSYCSVTDVGLLALASISCLHCINLLHLRGLTANGLAAALLACGGLRKVKLHLSFKPLLAKSFLEHIETRGCVLQWRDKAFQADIDSKAWKLELEDMP
ncbi:PREDICTED: F-box/LRR-repeat protein 3-like isoform X2 [Nelumbo nucifera]|uniref:F-box/LRR-repeat protein 3-like isoform X2 n=1 Tax=Nelumbo nucifera TaxID=4432 RepID=A0A1U8Q5E8_NELNU|nr:PREDICTED: F-box/LRR-repeat protein 3-like isoform X2 [Nelumbo nucifera]